MNKRTDKAFTLVELLVAMGLFAAIMVIGVLVFRTAIHSQQAAARVADFMRDIGSATQLLSDDFSSVDSDAPFGIWFDKDGNAGILVFVTGNFQQISRNNLEESSQLKNYAVLVYKIEGNKLIRYFKPVDRQEDILPHSLNANEIRNNLFNYLSSPTGIVEKYELCDNIGKFAIEMFYDCQYGVARWYPDDNPYPQHAYSDFELMVRDSFGVFFNIDAAGSSDFYPADKLEIRLIDESGTLPAKTNFGQDYKPEALKFILTLIDVQNNLDDKTFTYVVEIKG